MDDLVIRIQPPCQFSIRRLLFMIGIVASFILVIQTFTLPYRIVLWPILPNLNKGEVLSGETTSLVIKSLDMFSLLSDTLNSTNPKELVKKVESAELNNINLRTALDVRERHLGLVSAEDVLFENITDLMEEDVDHNRKISLGLEKSTWSKNLGDQIAWVIPHENVIDQKDVGSAKFSKEARNGLTFISQNITYLFTGNTTVFHDEAITPLKASLLSINGSMKEALAENSGNHIATFSAPVISPLGEHVTVLNSTNYQMMETHLTSKAVLPLSVGSSLTTSGSKYPIVHIREKNPGRLPISVSEMRQFLLTYHSSNHQMWNSPSKKQLLAAKGLLHKAPFLKNDVDLYGPAFLNMSRFRKSYELMERILKIYVYKEGNKPVFHQPLLRGIYASEGWFMKLLQADKHFIVRDHRKAHLFYIPFSSRLLQLSLYVHSSHSHRNLVQHLRKYVDLIAAKYPYWNQTGGADHFVAACHDWAPRITSQAMEASIRALCNADLRGGFQLGKDVSLPEIYIRSSRNPLKDLGGNSAENRSTLAFYAGNLHGRLRPILLQHWENKDPDMKILGPMPAGVESKMEYIQHMKNSKYCICPRGYEVNSPRVVESIYYECVPVILSDNYVPPFFEVLNWEAFSVIIPEKDVPRLKDVLVSIPEEKYRLLQLGVRKVQQHFLWHNKPVKYDLFHMILHSIWHNRLHRV